MPIVQRIILLHIGTDLNFNNVLVVVIDIFINKLIRAVAMLHIFQCIVINYFKHVSDFKLIFDKGNVNQTMVEKTMDLQRCRLIFNV